MTDQPAGVPGSTPTAEVPWYERPVEAVAAPGPAPSAPPAQPVTPARAVTAQLPVQIPAQQPPPRTVGAAPWVPAPRPAPAAPPWLGSAAGPQHGGGPAPVAVAAPRRGPGVAVWAAVGALVAAALVVAGIVWGPALWDGGTASGTAAPSPSAAADAGTETDRDEDPAPADDETVAELPTLDEDPGTSAGPSPVEPGSTTPEGDLGLAVPMTAPACDGSWAVFMGAATDAARYAADVQTLLDSNPQAKYTLTQGGCSSMRQQLPDGTLIYAVWAGPYPDQASACAARTQFGEGAYVKRMDDSTPPDQLWQC